MKISGWPEPLTQAASILEGRSRTEYRANLGRQAGRYSVELTHQRGAERLVGSPQVGDNRACARSDKRSDQACDAVLRLISASAGVARRQLTREAFSRRSRISRSCRSRPRLPLV